MYKFLCDIDKTTILLINLTSLILLSFDSASHSTPSDMLLLHVCAPLQVRAGNHCCWLIAAGRMQWTLHGIIAPVNFRPANELHLAAFSHNAPAR